MTEYQYLDESTDEAQTRLATSFLLAQSSPGLAVTGVLSGLAVSQTSTESASVSVGAGAAVSQVSVLLGVSLLVSDTVKTLDVLAGNPMGATPRNDLVVFDPTPKRIVLVVGVPGADPQDPAVPSGAVPQARLRHAANATTVPGSAIDDLRTYTGLHGVSNAYLGVTTGNVGKRMHRQDYPGDTTDGSGFKVFAHDAGFTPTAVAVVSRAPGSTFAGFWGSDNRTSTSWRSRWFDTRGTGAYVSAPTGAFTAFFYE